MEIKRASEKELLKICEAMIRVGYDRKFATDILRTAIEVDGVADLVLMWRDEQDPVECDFIMSDIKDMLEVCGPVLN